MARNEAMMKVSGRDWGFFSDFMKGRLCGIPPKKERKKAKKNKRFGPITQAHVCSYGSRLWSSSDTNGRPSRVHVQYTGSRVRGLLTWLDAGSEKRSSCGCWFQERQNAEALSQTPDMCSSHINPNTGGNTLQKHCARSVSTFGKKLINLFIKRY